MPKTYLKDWEELTKPSNLKKVNPEAIKKAYLQLLEKAEKKRKKLEEVELEKKKLFQEENDKVYGKYNKTKSRELIKQIQDDLQKHNDEDVALEGNYSPDWASRATKNLFGKADTNRKLKQLEPYIASDKKLTDQDLRIAHKKSKIADIKNALSVFDKPSEVGPTTSLKDFEQKTRQAHEENSHKQYMKKLMAAATKKKKEANAPPKAIPTSASGNMDEQNKFRRNAVQNMIVDKAVESLNDPRAINPNQRIADRNPTEMIADELIRKNLGNIDTRNKNTETAARGLTGLYDEASHKRLRRNIDNPNYVTDYADNMMRNHKSNYVIERLREENRKSMEGVSSAIDQQLIKKGAFNSSARNFMHGESQKYLLESLNRQIGGYLEGQHNKYLDIGQHRLDKEIEREDKMPITKMQVEKQIADERLRTDKANLGDVENYGKSGADERNREQAALDLQNKDFYLQQDEPVRKLKELAEFNRDEGNPTFADPHLRYQLDKPPESQGPLWSKIAGGAGMIAGQHFQDQAHSNERALDRRAYGHRNQKSGGLVKSYGLGGPVAPQGVPMGTPDEYNTNKYNGGGMMDLLAGALSGSSSPALAGMANASLNYNKQQRELMSAEGIQGRALSQKIAESQQLQAQRAKEWKFKEEESAFNRGYKTQKLGQDAGYKSAKLAGLNDPNSLENQIKQAQLAKIKMETENAVTPQQRKDMEVEASGKKNLQIRASKQHGWLDSLLGKDADSNHARELLQQKQTQANSPPATGSYAAFRASRLG